MKVHCYYLDMYFTDYKIVIECDVDDRDRMDNVNFEIIHIYQNKIFK